MSAAVILQRQKMPLGVEINAAESPGSRSAQEGYPCCRAFGVTERVPPPGQNYEMEGTNA